MPKNTGKMLSRHSEDSSNPQPQDFREIEKSVTTSDTIEGESLENIGPSALSGTARPYLARVLDFSTTEMRELDLTEKVNFVDSYVLALVKERNWADTQDSYNEILDELKMNLGFHRNLDSLRLIELLAKGVNLLVLQKKHRKRDEEIQRQIDRLNQ